MKISKVVSLFHSSVTGYIVLGWLIPYIIHSKILVLFIPSIYVSWLIDDNKCVLTRLENYYIKKELNGKDENKELEDDGFIKNKFKSWNINLSDKNIHSLSVLTLFHTFVHSYYNLITN